jgi:hypothetical protein
MPHQSAIIARAQLPSQWPTGFLAAQFWEQLGRTIATFGLLEEVLGKAIFAFTATTEYSAENAAKLIPKWHKQLEQALTDTLWPLSEAYGKAVRELLDAQVRYVGDLVEDIKRASKIRNALCHGSWHTPDTPGKADLHYFDKNDGKLGTRIDIPWMRQVQAHVVDLICSVINSVTIMGWEFPGGAGPGEPIWPR